MRIADVDFLEDARQGECLGVVEVDADRMMGDRRTEADPGGDRPRRILDGSSMPPSGHDYVTTIYILWRGSDDTGPDPRLFVRGRRQPLCHRRDPRIGVTLRLGVAAAQFQVFNNDLVIGAAIVLYLIEFFADKIPYVDTLWDMLHTADQAGRGRAHCGDDARRGIADSGRARGAARRNDRRRESPDKNQHSCRRQHQPRAVLELDSERRRGSVRRRSRFPGAAVSTGRSGRRSRADDS